MADLRPGDVFGEDALDGVRTRQQTVIAVSDVECFAIDASEFALVIEQGRTCSTADDKFAFLRTVPPVLPPVVSPLVPPACTDTKPSCRIV